MISIKGLNKFFNKERQNEIHVLNDINLSLPEKGMVAIFGKSGCGKTTLLNVIGGLDGFQSGEISIEGNDIRKNTDLIRNKYVGYIFQNYNLSKNETCFDNVANALRLCGINNEEEIATRVAAALKNVGMENFPKRTPDTLSGGQQQRIAIARALVKNPRIILADEPTGNLDEINTVMIMDLLKAISREHLVILVTHEANLVDHYCDTVIELSDGKVVSTKSNEDTKGFVAKGKNDLYLGELERSELSSENASIEYYGDTPASPIKLKIINSNGKIYLKLENQSVQIIDQTSEINVWEGVYEEQARATEALRELDMSALPTVEGKKFGRLFSFKSSVKSGYHANFKNRKRGTKALAVCLMLFSIVNVFMSALFGTAFRDLSRSDKAYNHNVFYLYTPNESVSSKLNEAVGDAKTAIDSIRLKGSYPSGDTTIAFKTGSFETFDQFDFSSLFRTNAVFLDAALAKDLPLLEGKKEGLASNEIIISSRVADDLLEKSALGYIKEKRDLLGLISIIFTIDGKSPRIAGIVESDESAIYISELALAKYAHSSIYASRIALASDYGITLNKGETLLAIPGGMTVTEVPELYESIKIQGQTFKVVEIKSANYSYASWLVSKGIKKSDEKSYFTELVKAENPELSETSTQFSEAYDKKRDEGLYEYYDYYYSELEDFCRDLMFFASEDINIWLYVVKGIEIAKYVMTSENYYRAVVYKEQYGKYPTVTEIMNNTEIPYAYEAIKEYYVAYEEEFYRTANDKSLFDTTYLVSEEDYIALSKSIGETHPSAGTNHYFADEYPDGKVTEDYSVFSDAVHYTVIHSSSPEKTELWLRDNFADLASPSEYQAALITPDDIFNAIIKTNAEDIIANLIAMAVIIVIMCICMYFIMHASLMNRIKEVGIYRAIGVSGKNLIFKFFVEAAVILSLTVIIGYLISSAFLFICCTSSSLMAQIFYYPAWLALSILGVVSAITLFFGALPIILLLRKTPSEILSKYDI